MSTNPCLNHWIIASVVLFVANVRDSFGAIWVSPLSAAGVVGKNVIFECSTTDLKDHVQWFFKSPQGTAVSVWEKPGIKNKLLFDKIDVLENTHDGGHFGYDLKISNLKLEDVGTYTCVVTGQSKTTHGAKLSVLEIDTCFVTVGIKILAHECVIVMAGATRYRFGWSCHHYGISDYINRTDEITNYFGERISVEVGQTGAKLTVPDNHPINLITCYLEIASTNHNGEDVYIGDHEHPYFNAKISFASEMPNILEKGFVEKCPIEANGVMRLIVNVHFDEIYAKRHKLFGSESSSDRFICTLTRPTLALVAATIHLNNVLINCEELNGMECLKEYTRIVEMGSHVPRLSARTQKSLCASMETVEKCVAAIEPCGMGKRMKGMLESYRFLCESKYDPLNDLSLVEVEGDRCFDHYPQSITNLLIEGSLNSQRNAARLRNISTVNYAFCQHMAGISNMHCIEHMLASYKSLAISRWYERFTRLLNQVDLFRLMSFSDINMDDRECWETIEPLGLVQCPFAEDCATAYDMLLRSIHFGMVFVDNFTIFDRKVCRSEVDLGDCQKYLVNNCDIPTSIIYNSLVRLKIFMCKTFRRKLKEYQQCLMSMYTTSLIPDKCAWNNEFTNYYAKQHVGYEAFAESCKMARDLVACVEGLVTKECGLHAGRIQRELMEVIFSDTILRARCLFLTPFQRNIMKKKRTRFNRCSVVRPSKLEFILLSLTMTLTYKYISSTFG